MESFFESDKSAKDYLDEAYMTYNKNGQNLVVDEYYGQTTWDHDHSHKYVVHKDGTGMTVGTDPSDFRNDHQHEVKDFMVLEANGHTHAIRDKTVYGSTVE